VTPADVPLRPAATVMLVRDAEAGGIEVLMVRRTVAATTSPRRPRLAWRTGGLAFWVAAIRECFEEAGLLLGHPAIDAIAADRWAVHRGELSMAELCRRPGVRLDAGALQYVSHWVTPVGETPRRFDTRFFLAAAPVGQDGRHDDAELVESRWLAPAEALAAAGRRELMLMPPTEANLQFIASCSSLAEALARADDAGPPPRIEPRLRRGPDGRMIGIALPDDPDYDELA
jgi:8-oxo-dGTP pyrophosphatase MutT (NUDIX family)